MSANSVIGVDVGGTKILAGVVGRDGSLTRTRAAPTPVGSQEEFLAGLAVVVEALLAEEGDVAAVGLGVPSRVDQESGSALESTNVPLRGVALRDLAAKRFERPVAVDNDANFAALAEWLMGAGRGTRNMIMLTLGTGIGGGLILDGRPYRGATGAGAELGHIVIDHDGPPCQGTCTGRGHFEALVSGGAAERVARRLIGPEASSPDLIARARDGESAAVEAVAEMGRYLGSGLATVANTLEPELIVLGGGFAAAAGDLLLPSAREIFAREALEPARGRVRIEPARLGVAAGVVGAGLAAFDALDGRA